MNYEAVVSLMAPPACVAVIAWLIFRESNKLLSSHTKKWLSLICSILLIYAPLLQSSCFCKISGAQELYLSGAFGIIAAALSRTGYKYAGGMTSSVIACLLGFIGFGLAVVCAWDFMATLNIVSGLSIMK